MVVETVYRDYGSSLRVVVVMGLGRRTRKRGEPCVGVENVNAINTQRISRLTFIGTDSARGGEEEGLGGIGQFPFFSFLPLSSSWRILSGVLK